MPIMPLMSPTRSGCPLPFLSSMVEDCIGRGKSVQEGGAVYNFTGPQGFGIANMTDSLYAIKTLVYDQKKVTMAEYKEAMDHNFGRQLSPEDAAEITKALARRLVDQEVEVDEERIREIYQVAKANGVPEEKRLKYEALRAMIEEVPKYGNDIPEVDQFARDVAYTYTKPLEQYRNPRGGWYQAGLYPVSANVPLARRPVRRRTAGMPIHRLQTVWDPLPVGMYTAPQRRRILSRHWITPSPPTARCLTRNSIRPLWRARKDCQSL